MTLTILDFLYLVLIFFTTILGTLLIIVLVKVIKILGPVVEISQMYYQIKSTLTYYAQIPEIIKEKIVSFVTKTEEDNAQK